MAPQDASEEVSYVSLEDAFEKRYDAVVVPGGGLCAESGTPRPWVVSRLEAAVKLDSFTRYFIVLSRGTTHKPPPQDSSGFPIDEAAASAAYLLRNGVADPARILQDTWSLDTIGNAYYTRAMLADPLSLQKLIVITSAFHMPRTRAIFEWVFTLGGGQYSIDYCITEDTGLEPGELAGRVAKEQSGLETLVSKTIPRISTLGQLASFLHAEHGAYNSHGVVEKLFPSGTGVRVNSPVQASVANTY